MEDLAAAAVAVAVAVDLEGEDVAQEIAVRAATERVDDPADGAVAEDGVEDGEAGDVGTRLEGVVVAVLVQVVVVSNAS